MGSVDERISQQFAEWERRGRGWQVWPEPVRPEPPFQKFTGYNLAPAQVIDDGRKPGFFASFLDSLHQQVTPKPPIIVQEAEEPEPERCEHPLAAEFVASLPSKLSVSEDAWRAFLDATHNCTGPLAFELFGKENVVSLQFAASLTDAPILQRQLTAYVPEVPFVSSTQPFSDAWAEIGGTSFVVEFGLEHAFMLPLQTAQQVDPFVGLLAAMSEVQRDETALFQVLFEPVRYPWPENIWNALTKRDGTMLFTNNVPLIPGTKEKLAAPLYGVILRLSAQAQTFERSAILVQNMARSLRVFARPENNSLIPLSNDDYPFELHEEDLLNRQSRRSGMLLNREELAGLVHLPAEEVRAPKLRRRSLPSKAPPAGVAAGLLIGHNEHAGRTTEVRLTSEQRVRHMHVIGASGTGKSTLLFNLIRQDVQNGEGLAVLDPHGDLVERVLGIIPPERINDVVVLDPTDEEYSVGFNVLHAHSEFEKNLLASDLVSVFRRLSTSWGDQLNSVLNNAILAFLESSQGGTLADLRRFLLDNDFRKDFLATVRDPDIVFYWQKAFPQLGGNKSIGPVLTRLDAFLNPKPIRYLVSQRENKLDFAHMLDSGKIFLAKLPQGQMGRENSFLLGSLLVSKFQQMVMSRQRMGQAARRDFWLYMDEFQSFITPSMAEILSGARKYRLGLVLAHQELHQLKRDAEVESAIGNCATRVVFRVGDSDALALEKGFSSFGAKDLQSLPNGEAICRIERRDADFNVRVPLPEEIDPEEAAETRENAITSSRQKYATRTADIEAAAAAKNTAPPKQKPVEPAPVSHKANEPSPAPPIAETEPITAPISSPVLESITTPKLQSTQEAATSKVPLLLDAEPLPKPRSGRGGMRHTTIQNRIKKAAEPLGYLATLEQRVNGVQSIDVALKHRKRAIACEINITNTTDYEFGNVKKAIDEGYLHVAVISPFPEKLEKLKESVTGILTADEASRVAYYSVEEFLAHLERLAAEDAKDPPSPLAETVNRGWKVKRSAMKLSPAETKAREESSIKVIAESMRKKEPD